MSAMQKSGSLLVSEVTMGISVSRFHPRIHKYMQSSLYYTIIILRISVAFKTALQGPTSS